MSPQNIEDERKSCLDAILNSNSDKKLVVAGAGTGKTFTFKQVLMRTISKENLALTFINMLVNDMKESFGELAEVKTFHAFCKKILHEQNGKVNLVPYLTEVISSDAGYLDLDYTEFDSKFQNLEETQPEIDFYLRRGDYYEKVSFNDSVYRLYKELKNDINVLHSFEQIVVDEYQDFNLLEVEFINLLSQKGSILIAGDDDQAVYEGRGSSPEYLRNLYSSGEFEIFELPFCSRCTECIVIATNQVIDTAQKLGYLKDRISKRYQCFLPDKKEESIKYPKIITAQCTTGRMIPKYILKQMKNITAAEIEESNSKKYPTVLIIGTKQYLNIVYKELKNHYSRITYKQSEEISYEPANAYELLMSDPNSNLGWRILIEYYFTEPEIKVIVTESHKGTAMVKNLQCEFIENHLKIVAFLNKIRNEIELTDIEETELRELIDGNINVEELITYFEKKETPEETIEEETPSILLTSFIGSKGLSAGFVYIIGANNGSIPKDLSDIKDSEISQFIVALTRTRKQCHILSNKWLISPKDPEGNFISPFDKSIFLNFISKELFDDKGAISAKELK